MLRRWCLALSLLSSTVMADGMVWQDLGGIQAKNATQITNPLQNYRLLKLDETALRNLLQAATSSTAQARATSSPTLSLPLPDGDFAQINATPVALLSPELAAQYPELQAWKVTGTDGKILQGRIDLTPAGFHAMLDMPDGDTLFIDPQETASERLYTSFSKQANASAFEHEWSCATHEPEQSPLAAGRGVASLAEKTINTYRIAVAATGEYTQYHGGQDNAYSTIFTTVNRVNTIYNRDTNIDFQLVSNKSLAFSDPGSDPYNDADTRQSMTANQTVLDQYVGSANYDLGHVFSTAGGGLSGIARIASVCDDSNKAMAASGLAAPDGGSSAFYVDIVAHEIGHQFDASHTFNSETGSCNNNRVAATAYEPGSGSTVMSYSGLCWDSTGKNDNVQTNSHEAFHLVSISQIKLFAHTLGSPGNVCASKKPQIGEIPDVDAGYDYIIPAGTPFTLSGTGSDKDGDTLSYSWEQIDAGAASSILEDTTNNALEKVLAASSTPVRTIPDIPLLLKTGYQPGHILPSTTRPVNFALVARDGTGNIAFDNMKVSVIDTGERFKVLSPVSTTLSAGSTLDVRWNVADTDLEPINCSAVDIDLTSDGENYLPLLAEPAENDGLATITLPDSLPVNQYGYRIRVKCHDNIFFALSATNPAVAVSANRTDESLQEFNPDQVSLTSTGNSDGGGGAFFPIDILWLGGMYGLLRLRRR